MNDYRLSFPVTALARGLKGITALNAKLADGTGARTSNALGDPRDANGDIVIADPNAPIGTPSRVTWYGRPGIPEYTYTDLSGDTVVVAARGDPSLYYVHIRSTQSADDFVPPDFEMTVSDVAQSAAVLGIWLGDTPP